MDINTTLQKKSLAEEVSSLIREQINDGKLTKGEKLPTEPELMKLFGVGRSTVREAIKMLVNMGYLSVQQGRGTFVESVTETNEPFHQRLKRADIQELREVRDIIEAPIARLAAQRRTKTDLENMEIVGMVRGLDVAPEELAAFIKAFRGSKAGTPDFMESEDNEREESEHEAE